MHVYYMLGKYILYQSSLMGCTLYHIGNTDWINNIHG